MKTHLLRVALFSAGAAACTFAADETPAPAQPDSKMKDALNAQLLQDAKNITAAPSAVPAPPAFAKTEAAAAASQPKSAPKPDADTPPPEPAKEKDATLLPSVQVKNTKITDLDIQLREQEKQIAQEKEKAKPSELDKALNDPGVSKALTIFGGRSADERATSADERVSLMEDERDIIEQMKLTKDPVRKAELKKQLDDIRQFRRELEKPAQ